VSRIPGVFALIAVVIAAANSKAELPSPADDAENWLLAFVDVETTGVTPGYHEMIDIGVIVADLQGQEIDRLFLRIMPEHPERTSEEAAAINGFSVERWQSLNAVSAEIAVERLIEFHASAAGTRRILMVAHNSQFDAAFVDFLLRSAGHRRDELYYYYVLDIPSMAWSLGLHQLHGQRLAEMLGIRDEPRTAMEHTGITGADLNLRVYRELLRYREESSRLRSPGGRTERGGT
jgi:DNA polymerase III alpha subunit (gram-positive type)